MNAISTAGDTEDDTNGSKPEPSRIPPELAEKHSARASLLLVVIQHERKVYIRVAIGAIVIGLAMTLFVFGLGLLWALLWTLTICLGAICLASLFLERRSQQIVPRLVEGQGDDDLIGLYAQIKALCEGSVIRGASHTTSLQWIEGAVWDWYQYMIAALEVTAETGNLDSQGDVSVFGSTYEQLMGMVKAAPLFVPKPIISSSWRPWIVAAGYTADGD